MLCVAFFAAPVAHYAVDLACDYLVPHDPFDDVAHASRALSLALSGLAGMAAMCAALSVAIARARGRDDAFCRELSASLGSSALRLALGVTLAVVPLVAGMEAFDIRLAGGSVDDLGDLFGGSLLVGTTVSGLSAFVAGIVAWVAGRRIARAVVPILAIALVLILRGVRARIGANAPSTRVRRARALAHVLWFRRRLSGRAPPLLSPSIPA